MANKLSVLPNFEAWCRLIHSSDSRPKLVEHLIVTDDIREAPRDEQVAAAIRERSRNMAMPQEDVEKAIFQRSLGKIDPGDDLEAFEIINK